MTAKRLFPAAARGLEKLSPDLVRAAIGRIRIITPDNAVVS